MMYDNIHDVCVYIYAEKFAIRISFAKLAKK